MQCSEMQWPLLMTLYLFSLSLGSFLPEGVVLGGHKSLYVALSQNKIMANGLMQTETEDLCHYSFTYLFLQIFPTSVKLRLQPKSGRSIRFRFNRNRIFANNPFASYSRSRNFGFGSGFGRIIRLRLLFIHKSRKGFSVSLPMHLHLWLNSRKLGFWK